jgi:hypothetical protein
MLEDLETLETGMPTTSTGTPTTGVRDACVEPSWMDVRGPFGQAEGESA